MALFIRHYTGNCQAIIREVGNELTHSEVHQYYCPELPMFRVYFNGDVVKDFCAKHADECIGHWGYVGRISLRDTQDRNVRVGG